MKRTHFIVKNGKETFYKLEDKELEWCNLYNQSRLKLQQRKRQKKIFQQEVKESAEGALLNAMKKMIE